MLFRCAGINDLSFSDAEGLLSMVVFFQGCHFDCPGCQNKNLQDPTGGEDRTVGEIGVRLGTPYEALVLCGGEPLNQPDATLALLRLGKYRGLKTYLYTGYDEGDIAPEIKQWADVIIAGQFVQELATGGFPASSNQTIIRRGAEKE